MVDWIWKRLAVHPQDILGAAHTIDVGSGRFVFDLIPNWTSAEAYLSWAKNALIQNDEFGWDAAVCYAKRAACRQIDAFIVTNHLGNFSRRPYPEKMELLSQIGLAVPDILHELIIEPRNEIEHRYEATTSGQAKRSVELADLFLRAFSEEMEHKPIISFGWSISIRAESMSTPDIEYEHIEFKLTHRNSPMLLITCWEESPQVMIIHPKDEELMISPLRLFNKNEAIELASLLRTHERYSGWQLKTEWITKLKQDLSL